MGGRLIYGREGEEVKGRKGGAATPLPSLAARGREGELLERLEAEEIVREARRGRSVLIPDIRQVSPETTILKFLFTNNKCEREHQLAILKSLMLFYP